MKTLFCTPRPGRKPKPLQRIGRNALFEYDGVKNCFVPAHTGIRRHYIKKKKLDLSLFRHQPVDYAPNDKGNYVVKRADPLPIVALTPEQRRAKLISEYELFRFRRRRP